LVILDYQLWPILELLMQRCGNENSLAFTIVLKTYHIVRKGRGAYYVVRKRKNMELKI